MVHPSSVLPLKDDTLDVPSTLSSRKVKGSGPLTLLSHRSSCTTKGFFLDIDGFSSSFGDCLEFFGCTVQWRPGVHSGLVSDPDTRPDRGWGSKDCPRVRVGLWTGPLFGPLLRSLLLSPSPPNSSVPSLVCPYGLRPTTLEPRVKIRRPKRVMESLTTGRWDSVGVVPRKRGHVRTTWRDSDSRGYHRSHATSTTPRPGVTSWARPAGLRFGGVRRNVPTDPPVRASESRVSSSDTGDTDQIGLIKSILV